jgi:hypothetical protein
MVPILAEEGALGNYKNETRLVSGAAGESTCRSLRKREKTGRQRAAFWLSPWPGISFAKARAVRDAVALVAGACNRKNRPVSV